MRTSERGAVAALMAGVLAISASAVLGAARLGAGVIASARADSAADAAALAAADMLALRRGGGAARAAATETAAANGARLDRCSCSGVTATVTVSLPVGLLGARAEATARAEVRIELP